MNEILSRALNFASKTQPMPPEAREPNFREQGADQETFYQEKYIVALEEKLRITQERDTMAAILEEKNAQLESLIAYSAELERKLGISEAVVEEKLVCWIDVVKRYFKSFSDPIDSYEGPVQAFMTEHNLPLQLVQSDLYPQKYYGIPSSLHVEFAAYFSELWQKGLSKERLRSTDNVIDLSVVDSQVKVPEKVLLQNTDDASSSKTVIDDGDLGIKITSLEHFDSVTSSCLSKNSSRNSVSSRSLPGHDNKAMEIDENTVAEKVETEKSAQESSCKESIQIDLEDNDDPPFTLGRRRSPNFEVSEYCKPQIDQMHAEQGGSIRSNIQINLEDNEEHSIDRVSSTRSSPRLAKKLKTSPKKYIDTESLDTLEKSNYSPSKSFVPIVVSPPNDIKIKEHKCKGISMYIWLDILNAYYPDAVKIMKKDKELYKNAKSAVKLFLTDNYPSIGLSFKEMENQKLLYVPKSFEVTFKSWFQEEFNSEFKGLKAFGKSKCEPDQDQCRSFGKCEPDQDQCSVSPIKHEPDIDSSIVLTQGSSLPLKKSKSNSVRYNLILKDLFPEFHSQTKSSRGRIRNSVKEYLLEKVECLEDCKLLQKDRHGGIKVSYGVPREFLDDFQKWALVQLREEYGEMVPLADWER